MTLKIKRILAAWIDFMICTMLTSGIIEFILIPFSKFQDNAIFIVISMIAYVVTFFGFLLNKDRIFENASIGKKILSLKVVSINDQELSDKILFQRNRRTLWTLAGYPLMILSDNKSGGDINYNTTVIDTTMHNKKEK